MIGIFAAADVFLFYVSSRSCSCRCTSSSARSAAPRRQYAAVKFFLYSLVGGLFMLAAVIGLWVVRAAGSTFDLDALRRARHRSRACRALAVPRLLPRLRDQGAVLPVPHLAARRRWCRPGRRRRAAGRRDGQGRHVRHPALLPAAVPRGVALLRAVGDRAGAGRHHLRGAAGGGAERPQAPGQLHLDRALRLHRHRHLRLHHQAGTGAVLYMVNHGLATGLLFLVVGMFVARGGSPADRRLRRRRQRWCRCWPACSSSPAWPRWRCPAWRRSSASSWC